MHYFKRFLSEGPFNLPLKTCLNYEFLRVRVVEIWQCSACHFNLADMDSG
jgi:hypothetical protein